LNLTVVKFGSNLSKLCLIVLLTFGKAYGQKTIRGYIFDKESKSPLQGVIVKILNTVDSVSIAYSATDRDGFFLISFPPSSTNIILEASQLGYGTKFINRDSLLSARSLTIYLEIQSINLKEVRIKPSKIEKIGDTIRYSVAAFKSIQDRNIGDVLKRLPGIEVLDNGVVLYNGKPINKFYIEGLDLLNGDYGLAVNNISPKDVKDVEILENHQPIIVLKDLVYSDKAALNIKIDPKSKNKWVGSINFGLGFPSVLAQGDFTGLRIAKKNQNLLVSKSNNLGDSFHSELNSLVVDENFKPLEELSNPRSFIHLYNNLSPLNEKRFLFNTSSLNSLNRLSVLKGNKILKESFSYLFSRENYSNINQTENYIPGMSPLFSGIQNNSLKTTNLFNGSVAINKNTNHNYLNHLLKYKLSIETDSLINKGSFNNYETGKTTLIALDHILNSLFVKDKNIYSVSLENHYDNIPQKLFIKQDSSNIIGAQRIDQSTFTSHFDFGLTKRIHALPVRLNLGVLYKVQSLRSDLLNSYSYLIPIIADSTSNKIRSSSFLSYIKPNIFQAIGNIKLKLELPIYFRQNLTKNFLDQQARESSYLYWNPSLSINYSFGPFWQMSINFQADRKFMDIESQIANFVSVDYAALTKGAALFPFEKAYNLRSEISYRDPINSFFLTSSYTRENSNFNYITNQSFQDLVSITRILGIQHIDYKDIWDLKSNKSWDNIGLNVHVDLNYSNQKATREIFNLPEIEIDKNLLGKFSFDLKFKKNLELEYQGSIMSSSQKIPNTPTNYVFSINENVDALISLNQSSSVKIIAEHSYTNFVNGGSYKGIFIDLTFKHKLNKKIEISLNGYNVFNVKTFTSYSNNSFSLMKSTYPLRPANLIFKAAYNF